MKTGERPVNAGDRDRIFRLSRLDPRPGHTTVEEVRRVLGPPNYTDDGGRFVAYYWETTSMWLLKRTNIDLDNWEADKQKRWDRRLLVLEFDDKGVLLRHRSRRVQSDVIPSDAFDAVVARWVQPPT
jgi:hypothetical protein